MEGSSQENARVASLHPTEQIWDLILVRSVKRLMTNQSQPAPATISSPFWSWVWTGHNCCCLINSGKHLDPSAEAQVPYFQLPNCILLWVPSHSSQDMPPNVARADPDAMACPKGNRQIRWEGAKLLLPKWSEKESFLMGYLS